MFAAALALAALRDEVFRTGDWVLGERRGWDGNDPWPSLVVWGWHGRLKGKKYRVPSLRVAFNGDRQRINHLSA